MMITQNRTKIALTLAAVAMAIVGLTAASAQATTITGTAGGNDSWNTVGNWDAGVPSGAVDAIVSDGVSAQVNNAATPTYSGSLTLNSNSTLTMAGAAGSENAVEGASGITMNAGSEIQVNMNANVDFPAITLAGDATLSSLFGASDHQTDNYSAITGAHTLTMRHFNNHTVNLNAANSFSELIANAIDRWNLRAKAAGSLGTGDVTINPRADGRSAQLYIDAADAMADTATLTLNGKGYDNNNDDRITMNADDTIAALYIDDVQQPLGDYTNSESGLSGSGTLTVKGVDPNAPEVDAGVDWITWSGNPVDPNGAITEKGTTPWTNLTYLWTAVAPAGVTVQFDPVTADVKAPTVTITKDPGDATTVMLILAVSGEGKPDPVTDIMTIDVYDDACLAMIGAGQEVTFDPGDVTEDCITNIEDFAVLATAWLDDYSLTAPAPVAK